jgi:hypothetical protein
MKFDIIINPFTKLADITANSDGKNKEQFKMTYSDADEWNSFKIDNKVFDIHFYYDEEFTVSIYEVFGENAIYSEYLPVNLTFKMNEK